MFLKVSQLKASTLCAGSALLVLGGFMSVNLAGCGGGGGGGNALGNPTSTPSSQTITFRLRRQDNKASKGGTVTLSGPASYSATASTGGVATISSVTPGTYTVRFAVVDAAGTTTSTTTTRLTISRASGQSFLLIQDNTLTGTGTSAYTVSGTVLLNPDDGDTSTPNCVATQTGVTDNFLVSALDLDTSTIIAQVRRSTSSSGTYTIVLPYKPASFRIDVGQFDTSGARYAGRSAVNSTNTSTTDSITGVNVCVNSDGTVPAAAATPSPTPSASPGTIPPFNPTATATGATPTETPTTTPTGTVTSAPTTTPTGTLTPTTTPTVTQTPTITPTP